MRTPLRQAFTGTWSALGASQRVAFAAIALVVVVVAALTLVATPLSEAIARMRDDVARSRLVLDVARARVAENAALARGAATLRPQEPRAAIDRALAREGLKYAAVDAHASDGGIRIVIDDARFDALVRALDTLARGEGIRTVEATLTARVDAGSVRAELFFAR